MSKFTDREKRNAIEASRSMLVRGIAHAKAKERLAARRYLEKVLHRRESRDHEAKAAYWMARISDTKIEAEDWLETTLAIDSHFAPAQRALMVLQGKLDPKDIVDPNKLPTRNPESITPIADRFECPNCGSRMVFDPNHNKLTCQSCGYDPDDHDKNTIVEERPFVLGMATMEAHAHAIDTLMFECTSCSAQYILPPKTINLTCAHCDSVYTIQQGEMKPIIPPDGIIPFNTSEEDALAEAKTWLKSKGVSFPSGLKVRGVYLPIWTYDIGGGIQWNAEVYDNRKDNWDFRKGVKPIFYDDVLIPASKPTPKKLVSLIRTFGTQKVIPFKSDYIAGWLAETYQITMSDGAVLAREVAAKMGNEDVKDRILGFYRRLNTFTSDISIISYKLVLLPVWIGSYHHENKQYDIYTHGVDTAFTNGTLPPTRLQKFADWLFGGENDD